MQSAQPTKAAFHEGLARVLDPSGRAIPAKDFIGQIEMQELGRLVDCKSLELGIAALTEHPALRLSINMSARSVGFWNWRETLDRGLAQNPTLAERLILEITESSAVVMPDVVQSFMIDMQDAGVSFALDDFGAGYTAFRYFMDFIFDILKIDGQFIRGISKNPDNQVLVKALVSIGTHFDMFTVAESVESEDDARCVTALGIDCMQGYYYGAPTLEPSWQADDPSRLAG